MVMKNFDCYFVVQEDGVWLVWMTLDAAGSLLSCHHERFDTVKVGT